MAEMLALFFYFSPGLGTVMLLWFVGAVLLGAFVEFVRRLTGEKWTWDDFEERLPLVAMIGIGIGGADASEGEGGWEGGGFGDPGGFGGFGGGLSGGGGAGGKW